MSDKKLTTEELAKQVEEARKTFDNLSKQLQEQKKEEEKRKQAELALVKEARKKEVEDALDNYRELVKAYIEDYGSFSINVDTDKWSPFFSKLHNWWF